MRERITRIDYGKQYKSDGAGDNDLTVADNVRVQGSDHTGLAESEEEESGHTGVRVRGQESAHTELGEGEGQ